MAPSMRPNDGFARSIAETFAQFDTDKSGTLEKCELDEVFRALGVNMDRNTLDSFFKQTDLDGDNKISLEEFYVLCVVMFLTFTFTSIDENRDGKISKDELRKFMSSASVAAKVDVPSTTDVEKIINDADKDGDGCINFDEFIASVLEA